MTLNPDSAVYEAPSGLWGETEVIYRPEVRGTFTLTDRMFVEPGTIDDWKLLHHLHYKSDGKPPGPTYWKLTLDEETIGVVVISLPRPLIKERHAILDRFKPGQDTKLSNTARYKAINANFRVVSRAVVDSAWRGCGIAYRFVNLTARMSGWRIVEIQSSMSKYNQFAQRAGFKFVKPMRSNNFDQGLKMIRTVFAAHPADIEALLEELRSMKPAAAEAARDAVRKYYWRNSSMEQTGDSKNGKRIRDRQGAIWEKIMRFSDRELLHNFQQLVLASPLYGIYYNPDFGRVIPNKLPLSAFDRQPPNMPLIL